MAKEWCLWLGERSELTGRLVCDGAGRRASSDGAGRSSCRVLGAATSQAEQDGVAQVRTYGAGRSRTEQDGAGRSRTEQDGAGRSRTEQDGAGRSRTEQDGAGRSRTEQDGTLAFAANARLRRVVSIIALIAFVLLPKRPLYHIPGNRQAHESAAPCGRARRRAHPPCRPPRRRGSAAAGRAGRAARCRPCSGSTPPRHDRELLPAITMRVRLRARRAVRSTAPECPALPSPRRAVATRLQPSPIEPGAHAQHYAFDIRPVPRAIRKCFESYQILRRAGIQKDLGQELVEGRSSQCGSVSVRDSALNRARLQCFESYQILAPSRSSDYPLLNCSNGSAPREMSIGMPRADWSRSTRVR